MVACENNFIPFHFIRIHTFAKKSCIFLKQNIRLYFNDNNYIVNSLVNQIESNFSLN